MVHSVYKPFDPNLPLHSIYLYYFSAAKKVAVYEDFGDDPVPSEDIPSRIASLVTRIKADDPNLIKTKQCKRRSCFAVVLDDRRFKLEANNAVKIRWIVFPSGAFRDGQDVPVVTGHADATAFFCFNHMRHMLGHVLQEREEESFTVTLVHNRPSLWRYLLTGWVGFHLLLGWLLSMRNHDDSGTNLGPPQSPPN